MNIGRFVALGSILALPLSAQDPDFTMTMTGVGLDVSGSTLLAPGTDVSNGFELGALSPSPAERVELQAFRADSSLTAVLYMFSSSTQPKVLTHSMQMAFSSSAPRLVDLSITMEEPASLGGASSSVTLDVLGHGQVSGDCAPCTTKLENVPLDANGLAVDWSMVLSTGTGSPFGNSVQSFRVVVTVVPASCMEPYDQNCGAVLIHPFIDWASPSVQRIRVASFGELPFAVLAIGDAPLSLPLPPALGTCRLLVDPFVFVPLGMSLAPGDAIGNFAEFAFPLPQTGTFYFQGFAWGTFNVLSTSGLKFECP